MAEVLDDEAEQIRGGSKKKAFGQWVKQQVAAGMHGKELADAIKARKDELKAMTGGSGAYTLTFDRYGPAPIQVQHNLAAAFRPAQTRATRSSGAG